MPATPIRHVPRPLSQVALRAIVALVALVLGTFVGACGVDETQEVELGRSTAAQIEGQLPMVQDPAVTAYVTRLGMEMARRTSRANLEWRFRVVDAAEVNAFALPGGFVYINRGLIERSERLDQFAGVLGHEIAHVVLRHSAQQLEKRSTANTGVTLVCTLTGMCSGPAAQVAINVAGSAWFARHSRAAEAEADSAAIDIVQGAGIDPRGIPAMFAVLQRERRQQPGLLDSWFGSHPLEEDRIQRTGARVEELDPRALDRLVSDDASYQSFRVRLRALPPSPTPRALPTPQ